MKMWKLDRATGKYVEVAHAGKTGSYFYSLTKPRDKKPAAPAKKNPSTRTIKPRDIATRYKFCVEFSDNQHKWTEYGAFTAREIADDIAHHLSKKYPTIYIRVSDKTRK